MLLKQNRRQKFSIGVASVLAATAVVGGTVVSAQDMEQREVTEAAVSRMWKKKYEDMKLNYVDLAQVQNKIRQELTEKLQNTKKDRKSTRLNSSHANISYAVFCLKKKKINTFLAIVQVVIN